MQQGCHQRHVLAHSVLSDTLLQATTDLLAYNVELGIECMLEGHRPAGLTDSEHTVRDGY